MGMGNRQLAPKLPNDHWVSRGYQQNFADGNKRVAILDIASGRIVAADRPIKSNFRERGFTTYLEAGVPNDMLEKGFGSVEKSVLNQIRQVSATNHDPKQKAAVANLFAVHLVRSPSFKALHRLITDQFRQDGVAEIAADPRLAATFETEFGRPPRPAELLDLVLGRCDEFLDDPSVLVHTMARQHDLMAEKLNRFHMQVIHVDGSLPGLVLGDTPVVHAHTATGRYGFRDRLALLDGTLIIGPLTRYVAACFTAQPLASVTITTHRALDALNAVFVRSAAAEVACHPDDARRLQQVNRRLDRLPPELFLHLRRR
jgi:hypothetical protein